MKNSIIQKRQYSKGLTLIEVAVYLILFALIIVGIVEIKYQSTINNNSVRFAQQIETYINAVKNYAINNPAILLEMRDGDVSEVKTTDLKQEGYLPTEFNDELLNKQTFSAFIQREDLPTHWNMQNFQQFNALVVTHGGEGFELGMGGRIALHLGMSGGVIKNGQIYAAHKNWAIDKSKWSGVDFENDHLVAFLPDLQTQPTQFNPDMPAVNQLDAVIYSNGKPQSAGDYNWDPLYTNDNMIVSMSVVNTLRSRVEIIVDHDVVKNFYTQDKSFVISPKKEWIGKTILVAVTPFSNNGIPGDKNTTHIYNVGRYHGPLWKSFTISLGGNLYQADYDPNRGHKIPTETDDGLCKSPFSSSSLPSTSSLGAMSTFFTSQKQERTVGLDVTAIKFISLDNVPTDTAYLEPKTVDLSYKSQCSSVSHDCHNLDDRLLRFTLLRPANQNLDVNWFTYGLRDKAEGQLFSQLPYTGHFFVPLDEKCRPDDSGDLTVSSQLKSGDEVIDSNNQTLKSWSGSTFNWDPYQDFKLVGGAE